MSTSMCARESDAGRSTRAMEESCASPMSTSTVTPTTTAVSNSTVATATTAAATAADRHTALPAPAGCAQRPMIVVVWGGIGAGKSTGALQLFEFLRVSDDGFAKVGVDDLVELVPEYRAAVESGDAETKEGAYMKYRDTAKELKRPTLAAAFEQRRNIYLEWTYEGNLIKFAKGEDAELPFVAAGYDVVLLYVACPDLEGILRNAATRERIIPEDTIRKYNKNRSKHFVEAANRLHGLAAAAQSRSALRAFVIERKTAGDAGLLREVSPALPLEISAEATDEDAWAIVEACAAS